MKPTVGRIVHYHNPKNHNGEPYAAIVLAVQEGGVRLGVMSPDGGRFIANLGPEGQRGINSTDYWVWPPRE